MASNVHIANMALSFLGRNSIAEFEEASAEARAVKLHYVEARRTLLQLSHWSFAKERAVLAPLASDWPERYPFRYKRPTQMLLLRRVLPPEVDDPSSLRPVPAETARGAIYTTISPAIAEMTVDVTDPTEFPPLFVNALAWYLAGMIAMPLLRDPKMSAWAADRYSSMFVEAVAADANQDNHRMDYGSEYIDARW